MPDQPKFAVIIPACDEEACIGPVLTELRSVVDPQQCVICVGVNGTSDATAMIAREHGAIVAETAERGYGHGCQAAIEALERERVPVAAYIFFAADGANDPRDIAALIAEHQRGADMVLGCRTRTPGNWTRKNFHYVIANTIFGVVCGLLTGRFFSDLGPLRLIERRLFFVLQLREWTYGWTIEAQIRAALLGAVFISEVPVRERQRIAGAQKVSHVSWRRTFSVGVQIIAAAFRTRFRERVAVCVTVPSSAEFLSVRPLSGTAGAERS